MPNDNPQGPRASAKRSRVEADEARAAAAAAENDRPELQPPPPPPPPPTSGVARQASPPRVQVGTFGSQLSKLVANVKELGPKLLGPVPGENSAAYQTLQLISSFLSQHHLAQQAQTHSTPASPREAYIATPAYYLPTLKEFAQSQLDRQAAGLRTNANRESAAGVTQLVESHMAALEVALAEQKVASLLSSATIAVVHKRLCPTHPTSGTFRTKGARAGQTGFCPPEQITTEMDLFWSSLATLQDEYLPSTSNSDSSRISHIDISRLYYSIALAAVTMYGINDIHPFADGNGRTSRIYANALLKQLIQLPFTVTIAATPQQRQEYIDGLRGGAQRLLEQDTPQQAQQQQQPDNSRGALEPLVQLLMERIAHAVVQVQSLLMDRARAAEDEEEARIARRVRERAAQGQCIICLDDGPNVLTLCCGQAVHLNCIAEWLANGTTCVYCRNPLPRMNVNNRSRQQPQLEVDNDDFHNLHDAFQAMQNAVQRAIELQNNIDGARNEDFSTTTSLNNDTDPDRESTNSDGPIPAAFLSAQVQRPICQHCQNVAATFCENEMCGQCCPSFGQGPCDRHGTVGDQVQSQDTTTTTGYDDNETTLQCSGCTNQAAGGCENGMCGRCCVERGSYTCARHQAEDSMPPQPEEDTSLNGDAGESTLEWINSLGFQPQPQRYYCENCSNQAAGDCANHMCGRCCVLGGYGHCPRHGGGY